MNKPGIFWVGCAVALGAVYLATATVQNDYVFFAGYVVIQSVLLATAWNIAGGYAGYVNFGTAGFFGAGAYAAVAAEKAFGAPLGLQIAAAAATGAFISLLVASLSVRLRGIYYSIATVAVGIILESLVINWNYVGGPRGLSLTRPAPPSGFDSYTAFLFFVMAILAIGGVAIARMVQCSRLGRGLAAIRDNEAAAEACGVPTLNVKIIAIVLSGAMMSMAGAPYALYSSYIDPPGVFSMQYSLATLAMPLLGGTSTWVGPVIGAIVLSIVQQVLAVYASSHVNLLVLGLILIVSVILLPKGISGAWRPRRRLA